MKNMRVAIGEGALVTWINKEGERVAVPLIDTGSGYKGVGVYLKYGASASDPTFPTIFPLNYGWEPTPQMLQEIRRTKDATADNPVRTSRSDTASGSRPRRAGRRVRG